VGGRRRVFWSTRGADAEGEARSGPRLRGDVAGVAARGRTGAASSGLDSALGGITKRIPDPTLRAQFLAQVKAAVDPALGTAAPTKDRSSYLPLALRHSGSGLVLIPRVAKACPGVKFEPSPFDP